MGYLLNGVQISEIETLVRACTGPRSTLFWILNQLNCSPVLFYYSISLYMPYMRSCSRLLLVVHVPLDRHHHRVRVAHRRAARVAWKTVSFSGRCIAFQGHSAGVFPGHLPHKAGVRRQGGDGPTRLSTPPQGGTSQSIQLHPRRHRRFLARSTISWTFPPYYFHHSEHLLAVKER